MTFRAVALGFEKDALKKTVELQHIGADEFRTIFNLDSDDPVVGASFPVERADVRDELQKHTSEKLDKNIDWFAEIQKVT